MSLHLALIWPSHDTLQIKEAQLNPGRASASIIGGSVIEKIAHHWLELAVYDIVCDPQQDAHDLWEQCEIAQEASFQGRQCPMQEDLCQRHPD